MCLFVFAVILTVTACSPATVSEDVPGEAPTQEPTAGPAAAGPSLGDTHARSADGMVMVYVPGGEFTMGSTVEEVDDALARCNEAYGDCQQGWFEPE
jgi:formylglycine-generating enzyme required for sulfatase activity